jgi:SAM-dependent methyltransferase
MLLGLASMQLSGVAAQLDSNTPTIGTGAFSDEAKVMTPLQYCDTAAAGYDEGVGCMTRLVAPTTLRMARLSSGLRVLDIAAGTGIASETAATIVGPAGHVTAADISPPMLEQARKRLSGFGNVTITVEDGTKLTFPEAHFDRVICNNGPDVFSGCGVWRVRILPRASPRRSRGGGSVWNRQISFPVRRLFCHRVRR